MDRPANAPLTGFPVLLGAGFGARAAFGEVYIEDLSSVVTVTNGTDNTPPTASPDDYSPRTILADTATRNESELLRKEAHTNRNRGLPEPAFTNVPTVSRLVVRGDLRPEDEPISGDVAESTYLEDLRLDTFPFDFANAAHFPLTRFGTCGEEFDSEGAVIHEGMRFVASPNGYYEVRFVTSTPASPVTIRLQFKLRYGSGETRTVSLPAVPIEPYTDNLGNLKAATWQVRHIGYSSALVRPDLTIYNPENLGIYNPVPTRRDPRTTKNACKDIRDYLTHGWNPVLIVADKILPKEEPRPFFISIERSGVARFGSYPSSQSSPRYSN